MVILGSADLETTIQRAKNGYKLYESQLKFDYIIVSGGCGAHKSSICEASEMKNYLTKQGVPDNIIFKEEKSKNTAQNYCYGKELKKADGTKIINLGDNVYVVSNHWHAISVAACFGQNDLTNSQYFIEVSITPSIEDKVDHTNIYNFCFNDENYCKSVTWPLVDASLRRKWNNKRHALLVY